MVKEEKPKIWKNIHFFTRIRINEYFPQLLSTFHSYEKSIHIGEQDYSHLDRTSNDVIS